MAILGIEFTVMGLIVAMLIAILVLVVLQWQKGSKDDSSSWCNRKVCSTADAMFWNPSTEDNAFLLNRVCPCDDLAVFGYMSFTRQGETGLLIHAKSLIPGYSISSVAFEMGSHLSDLPTSASGCLNPTGFSFYTSYTCPSGGTQQYLTTTIPAGIDTCDTIYFSGRVGLNDTGCANTYYTTFQNGRNPCACAGCPSSSSSSAATAVCNTGAARYFKATLPPPYVGSSSSSSSSCSSSSSSCSSSSSSSCPSSSSSSC